MLTVHVPSHMYSINLILLNSISILLQYIYIKYICRQNYLTEENKYVYIPRVLKKLTGFLPISEVAHAFAKKMETNHPCVG